MKGHLLRFYATPIVLLLFIFFCVFLSLLYCMFRYLYVLKEPAKCHCHSDVIIEQRPAGGIGQGGETMQASKHEEKNSHMNN